MPQGVRVEHIYRSDPDFPDRSSPLARPGVHIHTDDVIVAVNNVPLDQVSDIAVLLANKVDVPVKLTLVDRGGETFEEIVRPMSADDEGELRYADWELERREHTDSVSHNDIGYVHASIRISWLTIFSLRLFTGVMRSWMRLSGILLSRLRRSRCLRRWCRRIRINLLNMGSRWWFPRNGAEGEVKGWYQ